MLDPERWAGETEVNVYDDDRIVKRSVKVVVFMQSERFISLVLTRGRGREDFQHVSL